MNKTLQGHLDAIMAGAVTKTNVIGLRRAINLMERGGNGWRVPSYVDVGYRADVAVVEDSLDNFSPSPTVTGDLHESGLKVLRNPRYKSRWTPNQAAVIAELDHFKLVRFERIGSRGEYAVPVYRAVGFSGLGFNFMNIPWQSGGKGPEVVS